MSCVAELDEDHIRRMEDILAVYEKPLSEREPVVCVDEKPVVLHREIRPSQSMQPGRVVRRAAMANTSVAALPMCSAGCNRKRDGTFLR